MPALYTVGHSNRSVPGLLDLLRAHGIRCLVDVRRYPSSRRHPRFNRGEMEAWLGEAGIRYRHEEALGGHRSPAPDSPNTAWEEPGFRGYADHAATEAFRRALERVEAEARRVPAAVMCAEAEPRSCHRRILSDVLVTGGWEIRHILGEGGLRRHRLDERARQGEDGRLVYPAVQGDLFG